MSITESQYQALAQVCDTKIPVKTWHVNEATAESLVKIGCIKKLGDEYASTPYGRTVKKCNRKLYCA